MANPSVSAKAAEAIGLPAGFKTYSPFPFGGMNVQASSHAVADTEFPYIENFVHLGDGNFRTLYDAGPPIYKVTGKATIVYHTFFTIGVDFYCAVFLSDGSAVQVSMADYSLKAIGPAGTFYLASSGYLPFAKQWGSTYLLICNRNTVNDYWAWDGDLLYGAGSAAPQGVNILSGGSNYTSTPTAAPFGGHGSGMTLTATVNAGSVVELEVTNPGTGYLPGDIVQVNFTGGSDLNAIIYATLSAGTVGGVSITAGGSGYTGTPTIAFSGGGGSGAAGTVLTSGGVVTGVTITNPGSGYTSAPSAVISGGSGSGATAQPVLAPSGVGGVNIVSGGSGFTSVPTITFVGGGGAGATGLAVMSPTTISVINMTAGGANYTSAPNVVFHGGGTGATLPTATATLVGDVVGSIQITDAGSNITEAVTITFTGGGGSGAGATAVLAPTSIASVVISSTGKYYTDAPAVEVSPGANNSAYATVTLMPFGVSGSAMETFLSRVWIVNPATQQFSTTPAGNLYSFTSAGSITDFATSDGGGNATNTDSFLQTQYVNVRQSSGYLYMYGDGSVSVISSVNSSGTPITTTYNYQNVDPQAGLSWRDALQDFGRASVLANETGLYGLYGGAVTPISTKIAQLFNTAVYPVDGGVTPSSAIATIFNVKHYVYLLSVVDPDTGDTRKIMLLWNEKDWTVASQSIDLLAITTRKVGSEYAAWGTDGQAVYPLFVAPSSALPKRLDTKIYGADRPFIQKQALVVYMQAQDHSQASVGVSGTISLAVSGIAVQNAFNPSLRSGVFAQTVNVQPDFTAPSPFWSLWGTSLGGIGFVMVGVRYTTMSPDFTLGNLVVGYIEAAAYYGA